MNLETYFLEENILNLIFSIYIQKMIHTKSFCSISHCFNIKIMHAFFVIINVRAMLVAPSFINNLKYRYI